MRHLIPALTLIVLAAGCTTPTDDNAGESDDEARTAFIGYVDDLPAVDLDPDGRPEPVGDFTDAEVDAFAKKAVSLIERSISTDLEGLDPDDAVRLVLKNEYPETRADFRTRAPEQLQEDRWQFLIATLPTPTPSEPPRIVDVEWKIETNEGSLDDGQEAPVLRLWLQAHIVHTFGEGDERRVTVTRRHVGIAGFEPLGGSNFWPSIGAGVDTWGVDGCQLILDNTLAPGDTFELGALRASIEEDAVLIDNSSKTEFEEDTAKCEKDAAA